MKRMIYVFCLILLSAVVTTGDRGQATAQGTTFTSTTRVEIPGRLGSLLNAAASAVGSNEIVETTYVLNDQMRVDKGETSVITDLEWQTITTLNHNDKTFSVLTFDELQAKLEAARSQIDMADFAMEEAGVDVEKADTEVTEEEMATAVQIKFDVEWSGQKKRISRLPVEQAYLTMIAELSESESEQSEGIKGTFVTLNDMWVTPEVDGYEEVEAFQAKAGEMLGAAMFGKGGLEKMQANVLNDARIGALMESVRAESMKITGVPLVTDTYLILVPEGEEFERERVFPKTEERRGLQGAFRAARRTLRNDSAKSDEADESGQKTLLRLSIELGGFKTGGLTAEDFLPPGNYTEVDS